MVVRNDDLHRHPFLGAACAEQIQSAIERTAGSYPLHLGSALGLIHNVAVVHSLAATAHVRAEESDDLWRIIPILGKQR